MWNKVRSLAPEGTGLRDKINHPNKWHFWHIQGASQLHLGPTIVMWSFTVESEYFWVLSHSLPVLREKNLIFHGNVSSTKNLETIHILQKKTYYMTHVSIQPTFFLQKGGSTDVFSPQKVGCKKTPTAGPLHHRAATCMSWTLRLVLLGKMSTEVGRRDGFLVGCFFESSKWAGWLHSLKRTQHLKMDGWNICFLWEGQFGCTLFLP